MTKSKSDKPLVRNTILFCIAAMLIFHFAWSQQLFQNYHNVLFALGDAVLLLAFVIGSAKAYVEADEPNSDKLRYFVIAITVASCLWAAGWAAGLNERVGL
jgi:hypothetical protein